MKLLTNSIFNLKNNVAFSYEVTQEYNPRDNRPTDTLNWDLVHPVGDYYVLPYGSYDDLPIVIKNVIKNNSKAPGLINRKTELLWGNGPKLYKTKYIGDKEYRDIVEISDVQDWLENFEYEKYFLALIEDYHHLQGCFTEIVQSKGYLVNKPFINTLKHIPPHRARLAVEKGAKNIEATHCFIGDYTLNQINYLESKVLPLFDFKKPFSKSRSVYYSSKYSFCTDYYSIPDVYGSLEWIRRSTAVPLIFKALTENSMNLKYHIQSPAIFWVKKKEDLQTYYLEQGKTFTEQDFLDYQNRYMEELTTVLSGIAATGKLLHTCTEIYNEGHNLLELGWKIEVIDQKIIDFVNAQVKIVDTADRSLAAGISVHPVLGNITDTGRANSGSEQIYALLNYLNTGINIQEMLITKACNMALKANFPKYNVKIGFFHNVPEILSNINPENRSNNETTNQ